MLILWFASPFYHSLPENATRSRVPRLNAPNGHTPPTRISSCLRSRPRRGRRPRRPVSVHPRIPAHSRLSLRRGRRPRRPVFRSPIAGCTRVLHVCLRRPYFFQQRKKYGKERRQKPSVFGFPFRPIVTAVQKGSAPNRLHSYPRCRSRVPRLNAPNGHTPPTRISSCLRSRPRRGRRPRRPVSVHPRIPAHSRLSLRRGRRPRRPVSAHPRIPAYSRLSLRRGRRPRRPASAHLRIPAHSRLILRRGGVLPRPPPIFCFRMYASGGHISFNSERNMEKNAAKNHRFLDFPFVQL